MKILVLNCGSSSIKYKLYDMSDRSVMAQGGAERVGIDGAFVKLKLPNGEKKTIMHDIPEHTEGVKFIFSLLTDPEIGVIKDMKEIDAVGHRLVLGGDKYNKSSIIDEDLKAVMEEMKDLAPLHNPAGLKGVHAIETLLPQVPQVGVFDTAFHATMPDYAYLYPLPYEFYEKYHIRRYGYHGTSHRYVSQRVCEMLGKDIHHTKIITCHIGNGASISAVKNGVCIDTSMGLSPLAGLMMGTRCGDIDPSIVTYLENKLQKTPAEMDVILNKESGVKGITCLSSDMRDVEEAAEKGDPKAVLALQMYDYRIKKYIGAYAAAMGGVDVIVFTAGVGENQTSTRETACSGLEFIGVKIDVEKNKKIHGEEAIISTPDSKVAVCVVPTDEEMMIANDTMELVKK
ncbi:acetate kinase [Hoylesella marshii]|uniref:Acetate kinase n=1 Tax=Hoylesella marshii DSM 16973 = JCM 13450 TaxID=862515 RepID=E0NTY8_9BACT|nr:acetate kinase [Hoylesella marshii]EFM01521.1 acetate kinase [Hoylesella marshii DSM 16973 = JCM 13450]